MIGIDDIAIKDIVETWITRRDRMVIQNAHVSEVRQKVFIRELDEQTERLERELPAFTLAQLEGFQELVSQMLALRRMRANAFQK